MWFEFINTNSIYFYLFLVAIVLHAPVKWVTGFLWQGLARTDLKNQLDYRYTTYLMGAIERIFLFYALIIFSKHANFSFLVVWFAFKVASIWGAWSGRESQSRAKYNIFLTGTLLNFLLVLWVYYEVFRSDLLYSWPVNLWGILFMGSAAIFVVDFLSSYFKQD